jgi:WD40 repeat protein
MKSTLRLLMLAGLIILAIAQIEPTAAQESIGTQAVRWNSDSSLFAVALIDSTLRIFDAAGRLVTELPRPPANSDQIISLDWSPISPHLLALSTRLGSIQILELHGEGLHSRLEFHSGDNSVREIAWNADGNWFATIGQIGSGANTEVHSLRIWNAISGEQITTYQNGYSLTDVAWHPLDPNLLLVAGVRNYYGNRIDLWHVEDETPLWTLQDINGGVVDVAWSPDGEKFTSSTSGIERVLVQTHSTTDGHVIRGIDTDITSQFANIVWSPSEWLIVSGYTEVFEMGLTELWNVDHEQALHQIYTHQPALMMAWSTNNLLLIEDEPGIVRLYRGFDQPPAELKFASIRVS